MALGRFFRNLVARSVKVKGKEERDWVRQGVGIMGIHAGICMYVQI